MEGLSEGKNYKFRVKAVNKEGESEPLETEGAVVARNPYTVPEPPVNLLIEDWDNVSVLLTWEPPPSDGGRPLTHYILEQKGKYDLDFVPVLETPGPDCRASLQGLKEGQLYEWRVRAVNKAGRSQPSEPTPPHLATSTSSVLTVSLQSGSEENKTATCRPRLYISLYTFLILNVSPCRP